MNIKKIDGNTLENLPIKKGQVLNARKTDTADPVLPNGGVKALADFDLYEEAASIGMDFKNALPAVDWDVLVAHLIKRGLVTPFKPN